MADSSQLEAHEVALYKVFSSDYDFSIPEYQRPYAWRQENALQLVDDLEEALDRGGEEPYFLGSVVLVKPKGCTEAHVIDGQQRLTTLTLLFAVLRDLAEDATLRSEIGLFIAEPGSKVRGLAAKPRLALRPRDAAFFRKYVQEDGAIAELIATDPHQLTTDAQRAIRANAEAMRGVMSHWDVHRRLELLTMLSERTFLVVVSTADLDSAHRIFSVMNARGLDLSPADIFKAKVIGALDEGDTELYGARWEDAEESLGRDDFADLFLHVRVIYAKERARKVLLKEFEEQVLARFLPAKAREFVDDVVTPYAHAYGTIRDGSYVATYGAEPVNAWFRRLRMIDNGDWWPPALWALRHHGDDPAWLDDYFRSLERLASSMLIRRVYATPRATRYADLLRDLDGGVPVEKAAALTDDECRDTMARLDGELYLANPVVRRYVLQRLDEVLAHSPGVTYDHKIVSVEHVLPQQPRADSEWLATFDDAERTYWTHRLANLVLLNRVKNSAARNYEFAEKKRRYFTTGTGVAAFALTSQVLAEDTWSPTTLERRQAKLLDFLRAEWTLS